MVAELVPQSARARGKRGIGLVGQQDRGQTRHKIETYLAGALNGDKPTHTM